VKYALGNNIVGVPLDIDPNFGGLPNGNAMCDGNLIFGAIIDQAPPFRFDASVTPGCGSGVAVLDITGLSSLGSSDNSFGISFQPVNPPMNGTLRITRVIYILPETCTIGKDTVRPRFDFQNSNEVPTVSSVVTDCDTGAFLQDTCPSGANKPGKSAQADVFGIDRTTVKFYIDVDTNTPCTTGTLVDEDNLASGLSRTMAVEFPDVANDPNMGFDPEDRIRFGANVIDEGNGELGADVLGACGTTAIICFNDNTTVTETFEDNDEKRGECLQCVDVATWGSNTPLDIIDCNNPPETAGNHGLIIHPRNIPDLPCPAASGNNTNGQAILTASNSGGGAFPFAVRAQATVKVKSLFCELCGISLGPFYITAKETAFYDCARRCPRLIRIEPGNFFCPGPADPP
jgi:hypothetical protein